MKKGDLITALILEGVGFWVIIDSYNMGLGTLGKPGSGLLPFLMGILLCFLAIPICISSLKGLNKFNILAADKKEVVMNWSHFKEVILITAFFIGYFFILDFVGFFITTFLFLFGLFWIGYPKRWLLVFTAASLSVALTYLIFVVFLNISFPLGFWR